MIAANPAMLRARAPTVYDVLAARARSHSLRFLVSQAAGGGVASTAVFTYAPSWWPLATALAGLALYSIWGVIDNAARFRTRLRPLGLLRPLLAVLATIASVAAITGTGLAAFTGDAPAPHGTCYEPGGRAFPCNARGEWRALRPGPFNAAPVATLLRPAPPSR
jgi:hypothetical protein